MKEWIMNERKTCSYRLQPLKLKLDFDFYSRLEIFFNVSMAYFQAVLAYYETLHFKEAPDIGRQNLKFENVKFSG